MGQPTNPEYERGKIKYILTNYYFIY